MRILLDECVDRRLGREFIGHEVKTVGEMKWAGIKNGELLRLAELQFDVLITTDQHIEREQNVRKFALAFVVLVGKTNRRDDLLHLIPDVLAKINFCKPGTVTRFEQVD